jgi:hypothetical protein
LALHILSNRSNRHDEADGDDFSVKLQQERTDKAVELIIANQTLMWCRVSEKR